MRNKLISLVAAMSVIGPIFAEESTGKCFWIQDYITPVADFPIKGIMFQWYANLLKDPKAFHKAIQAFAERYRDKKLDAIAGLDSRGFVFGAALSYELNVPFVMIRKPGKLPRDVERIEYQLEYGKNTFEIEKDSLKKGDRVLVIDDVLATGGTAQAASELVERLGAQVVEVACLIELPLLKGREKVKHPVYSLISIDVE
jgi:adenine phosphoribosyltransferase